MSLIWLFYLTKHSKNNLKTCHFILRKTTYSQILEAGIKMLLISINSSVYRLLISTLDKILQNVASPQVGTGQLNPFSQSFYKLWLVFKPFPSSMNPQQEGRQCKWSPTFKLCRDVAQPFRNTVNHSFWWRQPTENLQCHLGALPKGMSIHRGDCVWMAVSEATLPTETIKSTVTASGQNKDSFFSHNSATLRLSKSQKTRNTDKEKLHGILGMERK